MKILFFDTETTGLDPQKHAIIQLAGVLTELEKGVIIDKWTFNYKIKPHKGSLISKEALAINKTNIESLKDYSEGKEVLQKFTTGISDNEKIFLAGYNVNFDYQFLSKFFQVNNSMSFNHYFWYMPIDVMSIALFHTMTDDSFRKASLADMLKYFKIKVDGELHDAMTDARATRDLFNHFLQANQKQRLF